VMVAVHATSQFAMVRLCTDAWQPKHMHSTLRPSYQMYRSSLAVSSPAEAAAIPRGVYAGGGGGEAMTRPFRIDPEPSAEELLLWLSSGCSRDRSSVEMLRSWLVRGSCSSGGGGAKEIDSFF